MNVIYRPTGMAREYSPYALTFASLEPTIEPSESLKLIERTLKDDSGDHYKIGKRNHYLDSDK